MHVTSFLTQLENSRRELRHPKPERHGRRDRGLALLDHLRVSLQEASTARARASTTKISDLHLADRPLGHQI